jgi:hypothetical protein
VAITARSEIAGLESIPWDGKIEKQRGEVAELVYRTRLESESTFTGTVSSNLTLSAIDFESRFRAHPRVVYLTRLTN